jgi:hypothetical protein
MGMHTLDDLKRKWQHEQITAEQVIGQLLQHIEVLYERLRLVERRLGSMEPPNTKPPSPRSTSG